MEESKITRIIIQLFRRIMAIIIAIGMTGALFLVLPYIQAINDPITQQTRVVSVDSVIDPPPPPPPEEQPPEEPEPEEEPPKLTEEAPPLDFDMLNLALNAGLGEGLLAGDFGINLKTIVAESKGSDDLFSVADLDQKPRVTYQTSPIMNEKIRRKMPGSVTLIFIVDTEGRVTKPKILKSTDPVFERPALSAIKRWKFDPGKKNGKPVNSKMKIPITFSK